MGVNGKMYVFGGIETGRRVNTVQVLDAKNGQWLAHSVGNKKLEHNVMIIHDATSEDDVKIHNHVGEANDIDVNADIDYQAGITGTVEELNDVRKGKKDKNSHNPFLVPSVPPGYHIPTPRNQHAACAVRYVHPLTGAPVHVMLVHGGEGAEVPQNKDGSVNAKSTSGFSKLSLSPSRVPSSTIANMAMDVEVPTAEASNTNTNNNKNKSSSSSSSSRKEKGLLESKSTPSLGGGGPGGVSVGDSLQQNGHKTGNLRVENSHETHLDDLRASQGGIGDKGGIELGVPHITKSMTQSDSHIASHDQELALKLQHLVSYEDLYGLDLATGNWVRLNSQLAPLPRRGHTLSVANVRTAANPESTTTGNSRMASAAVSPRGESKSAKTQNQAHTEAIRKAALMQQGVGVPPTQRAADAGYAWGEESEECVVLFGGFCRERESYSNSVHICLVKDLAKAHRKTQNSLQGEGDDKRHNLASRDGGTGVVTWRVLDTTGRAPPPRYRHSASVLRHSDGRTQSLVIHGGLGKGNVPLSDVYSLNLNTLRWKKVPKPKHQEPIGLYLGGGMESQAHWPAPVFGHSAVAMGREGYYDDYPADEEEETEEEGHLYQNNTGTGANNNNSNNNNTHTGGSRNRNRTPADSRRGSAVPNNPHANPLSASIGAIGGPYHGGMHGTNRNAAIEDVIRKHDQISSTLRSDDTDNNPISDLLVVYGGTGGGTSVKEKKVQPAHHVHHQHTEHKTEGMHYGNVRKGGDEYGVDGADGQQKKHSKKHMTRDERAWNGPKVGEIVELDTLYKDKIKKGGLSRKGGYDSNDEDEDDGDGNDNGNSHEDKIKNARGQGTRQTTLALDLQTGVWRVLNPSVEFPSQRCNHTFAFIENWSPGNPARQAIQAGGGVGVGVMGGLQKGGTGGAFGEGEGEGDQPSSSCCALVFGGSSLGMCAPEVWALDLHWRWPGIEGFQNNMKEQIHNAMLHTEQWGQHRVGRSVNATMAHSNPNNDNNNTNKLSLTSVAVTNHTGKIAGATFGTLGVGVGTGNKGYTDADAVELMRSASAPDFNPNVDGAHSSQAFMATYGVATDDLSISRAFQRVKKDRAHAEQQILKEKNALLYAREEIAKRDIELIELKKQLEQRPERRIVMPKSTGKCAIGIWYICISVLLQSHIISTI